MIADWMKRRNLKKHGVGETNREDEQYLTFWTVGT